MWVSKGDSMPEIDVGSTCQHLQYSDSWIFSGKNRYGGLGDGQKEVLPYFYGIFCAPMFLGHANAIFDLFASVSIQMV